jgi:hypothetical protein
MPNRKIRRMPASFHFKRKPDLLQLGSRRFAWDLPHPLRTKAVREENGANAQPGGSR